MVGARVSLTNWIKKMRMLLPMSKGSHFILAIIFYPEFRFNGSKMATSWIEWRLGSRSTLAWLKIPLLPASILLTVPMMRPSGKTPPSFEETSFRGLSLEAWISVGML